MPGWPGTPRSSGLCAAWAGGLSLLRVSAAAAALLYPGFLLAPGIGLKLLLLGGLGFATAPWYPLLQARLYGSLPDSSGIAVSLSSAAGLLGGVVPARCRAAGPALRPGLGTRRSGRRPAVRARRAVAVASGHP